MSNRSSVGFPVDFCEPEMYLNFKGNLENVSRPE